MKDTAHTRLEDKIITIVANLEILSEKIKEQRIEQERQRLIREEKERLEKAFKERQKVEKNEFKALFSMAGRLHKTFILRQFIDAYEKFLTEKGEMNDQSAAKLKWAREKADWLDPFISKEDPFLDFFDKDEITRPECPKQEYNNYFSANYHSSSNSYQYPFWLNPSRNRY